MYTHNLDPVLINFGFIIIRWYSLAYIFGIVIGGLVPLIFIPLLCTNLNSMFSISSTLTNYTYNANTLSINQNEPNPPIK